MQKGFRERHRDGVALLAEGVDRNSRACTITSSSKRVALLAEGVDRNVYIKRDKLPCIKSPSSRRAWIEIFCINGFLR